jgi:hypothetical protein
MRKFFAFGAALVALAVAAVSASAGNPNTLTLAVYGDAPYGTSNADTAEFAATPAFVTSINNDASVQEIVHVGDIHSGSQKCTVAYDQSVFNLWTAYRDRSSTRRATTSGATARSRRSYSEATSPLIRRCR